MKPTIVPQSRESAARLAAEARASFDTRVQSGRRAMGLAALGRRALLNALAGLDVGQVHVIDAEGERTFGRRTPAFDVAVTLEVLDPRFWADAAFGGTVGAGESYIHGDWRCSDLTGLVRIMVRNREVMERMEGGLAFVSAPLRRLLHWANRNSKDGSRDNIAAHYDLGNDFFRLFLDETMAYSCGIYANEDATLHEAQLAKFDAICSKLDLQPGETLVEIGTGWGGLAIHAAKHYGARVTTTTISKEQHAYAREWIAREGLEDRITLLLEDYRDLRGAYDKLVSVEMIEAVGHQYLDTYFGTCSRLLKPTGAMLLQAITLQDQHYANALKNVDFIQRFVFPGSFIPSVTAIADSLTRATDLKAFHLEDIGPHYATTLRHWRERCFARLPETRALGYPEEFVRLWEFYLCYCEGGFLERQLGDVHLLLTKPECRRAPIVQAWPPRAALAEAARARTAA
ncbi:MAG: cyclopropane-fatty-acyl-phospholipid synthase [Steroidobacteraceae bacterium]|jgi:cyclopropane-fatty-acyl-phospholipid synthase|nr:cyclopropane-fatty-acyl-phospholipid synthase [Steroidobacteraceae bacterium]